MPGRQKKAHIGRCVLLRGSKEHPEGVAVLLGALREQSFGLSVLLSSQIEPILFYLAA
ncbi:hypothetical protein ATOBIA_N16880 [Atopobiaceae bacterium P1]|uniref:Uncharacterized protein n=1 Tax=Leptogranulimonas caecicola TaxID=2894156 RepID=A0AAU9CZ27_9ACTN|nr:hypothetical protein ATOBIA_N16880 [Atopobiaceae bacterium P1]BDC91783.1 hypothetical protein ATTO_16550 [Leptogranulimonas caecicola]